MEPKRVATTSWRCQAQRRRLRSPQQDESTRECLTVDVVRQRDSEDHESRSQRGTRVAAVFESLIASAAGCGVEPHASVGEAPLRGARSSGAARLARPQGTGIPRPTAA